MASITKRAYAKLLSVAVWFLKIIFSFSIFFSIFSFFTMFYSILGRILYYFKGLILKVINGGLFYKN